MLDILDLGFYLRDRARGDVSERNWVRWEMATKRSGIIVAHGIVDGLLTGEI